MIRKTGSSEIFDEYMASLLKKDAGAKDDIVDIFGDLSKGVSDVVEETAPAGAKGVPTGTPKDPGVPTGKTEPTKKPPEPPVEPPKKPPEAQAPNPKALNEAMDIAVAKAGLFLGQMKDATNAMQEIIEHGKIISPITENSFAKHSPEEILKISENLLDPVLLKHHQDAINVILEQSTQATTRYKKGASVLAEMDTLRNNLYNTQRSFRETLPKILDDVSDTAKVVTDSVKETDELTALYKATIEQLTKTVGELTAKVEKQTADALAKAEEAGYLKGVVETMEKLGMQASPEYKVLKEVAEDTLNNSTRAATRAVSETPNPTKAEPIINDAKNKAISSGKKKGEKAATEAANDIGAESLQDATKPIDQKSKPLKTKKSFLEKLLDSKAGTELASSAPKTAFTALTVGAVLLLVAGGGAIWYLNRDDIKGLISDLNKAMAKTIAIFKSGDVRFVAGGEGISETNDLMAVYDEGISATNILMRDNLEDLTEPILREIAGTLSDVQTESEEYLEDSTQIAQELTKQVRWEEALSSIQEVLSLTEALTINLLQRAELAEEGVAAGGGTEEVSSIGEGEVPGISGPIAKKREDSGEATLPVEGTDITLDFENAPRDSAGFRSAARKIVNNVLTSPVGLAFVDPEGAIWTGALTRSSKYPNENYYWRTIGYLYDHGITTPGKLRRHMRNTLKRWERGRGTAWREALKYYRGRVANKYSMEFYLNNMTKIANSNKLAETSINKEGNSMKIKKFSDEHSSSYVRDALKGLQDEYAKSYFAGLKGMYDERLGSSEGDQSDLYRPLGGSGAETVGEAHPESLTIAESMGRGGLVENLLEQQRATVDVALSTPTGNFRHKRAELLSALVKEANRADLEGDVELSNLIDEIIVELTNE